MQLGIYYKIFWANLILFYTSSMHYTKLKQSLIDILKKMVHHKSIST